MLGLPPSVRIYFATELVDMRNGIDGLRAHRRGRAARRTRTTGHLFVFVGKSKDKVKILFWDRNGFVLYLKRLERGRFQLPAVDERTKHVSMEPAQLAMLLDGIDLNARRLARWNPDGERGSTRIAECDQTWSMVVPPVDHDCVLKDLVEELANRLAKLEHENAQLKKALLGSRSEKSKMPRVKTGEPPTPEERQKTRRERAAAKAQTPTVRIEHKVPDAERRCTVCGNAKLDPIGDGQEDHRVGIRAGALRARRARAGGAALPLRRLRRHRAGCAEGRSRRGSTARASSRTSPSQVRRPPADLPAREGLRAPGHPRRALDDERAPAPRVSDPRARVDAALDVVRVRHVVGADETRLASCATRPARPKNGFVWTFGAPDDDGELDVAYVFAEDRSGSTPKTLLEGTKGVLLVDGYSGYNVVEEVSTRRRAACHAHLRRYFHEALPTAPVAQEMLDLVAELYVAEHAAEAQRFGGHRKVGVSETARRADPRPDEGVARCAAGSASAEEPPRRRDPLRRQPVGRARRLPRRRARAARQQRLRACAPPGRPRPEELPLRRRRRRRQEHRGPLLARRDVRGARDQSVRLPRRRPRARAGSPASAIDELLPGAGPPRATMTETWSSRRRWPRTSPPFASPVELGSYACTLVTMSIASTASSSPSSSSASRAAKPIESGGSSWL